MSAGRWRVMTRSGLLCFALLFGLTGCFEVDNRSDRKLRIFYTSDAVGNVEPCG